MSHQIRRGYHLIYDGRGVIGASLFKSLITAQQLNRPKVLLRGTLGRHLYTSQNDKSETRNSSLEVSQKTVDEEFPVSPFHRNELVPEVPIKSLNIDQRISKIEKKGSFSVDIFAGRYDHDFLNYPEPLQSREETKQLKDQATMVAQLWPQIWDDDVQLQKFNFFNLYQLSVNEMMTVFEAIGASSRKCQELSASVAENTEAPMKEQTLVTKKIISLITRNCLTYWPVHRSANEKLRDLLPQKHILFGGSHDMQEPIKPLGFCWTEQAPQLGSLPPQEWQTFGQGGGDLADAYLIQGRKTKVLAEDGTENYLVFFRDKFLSERYEENPPEDEPNPASDSFTGCCVLHKSELKHGPIYTDSAGFEYTDVDIDVLVPTDRLVFAPERKITTAVNIKALGQLATSAVQLGMLKDSLRRAYKHLIDNKSGLLQCDIIERKLAVVTSKIFAIESMVYYIAGMYDGLVDGFDAHMETTMLKIVTNEYACEALQELQQVCGSEMFMLSRLHDQINIFDSFLDGNIYNRLYLSTMGVIWFARSKNVHLNQMRLAPWYPGYFLKTMFKERVEQLNWLTLDADIYGHLHPSLKEAAVHLDYIIKRVRYATENICMKHGKDVTGAQTALYKLAQLSIDSFLLTTLCARASKSYCNGSRHSEIDVALATQFSYDLYRRVKLYIEEIQFVPLAFENRSKLINELNMKMGGYYAESPLDPNV